MIKHIPITIYEEVNTVLAEHLSWCDECPNREVEWIDNNGINTPYLVTVVNKGDK